MASGKILIGVHVFRANTWQKLNKSKHKQKWQNFYRKARKVKQNQ